MGEKFAFVFDIAVVAIIAIFAFVGLKRGFARVVLGFAATAAAFLFALYISAPIAGAIYRNHIEAAIEDSLDEPVDTAMKEFFPGDIPDIDFSRVKINGTPADEIEPDYAGTRKAIIDFSEIDLSETGINTDDLARLGISESTDLASLNGKTAEISMDDIDEYGLGRIAVAQYIAVSVMKRPDTEVFNEMAGIIAEYLPTISGSATGDTMGISAVRMATLKMFETKGDLKEAVMSGVIEPNCTLVIRSAAFAVLFLVISLTLRIIVSAAKLVNKIPVLGKVNAVAGMVLGALEGFVAVFLLCLMTRLIVSLGGANFILFNRSAVDSTFIFRLFYDFSFLNFLK